MIKERLFDELTKELSNAAEIWVAVALMKKNIFDEILSRIPSYCKQHYIVGTDLPTEPDVLKKMKTLLKKNAFNACIYDGDQYFHPKVYLVKKNNLYIGYIGSANYTNGGLKNNVELTYVVNDQTDCEAILNWFNDNQKEAAPINDENIALYEERFARIKPLNEEIKRTSSKIQFNRSGISPVYLNGIDFSDRYFSKEHHLAFRKELWYEYTKSADDERKSASKRFKDLHEKIFPQFRTYGIEELQPNTENHLVSMYYQMSHFHLRRIDGMWLSYGKSQEEIKKYQEAFSQVDDNENNLQSFINHSRVQIKIALEEIGIWILFGKDNGGSRFDRDYFRASMNNPGYRKDFFDMLRALPEEFWITVNNQPNRSVHSFDSPESLQRYCRDDNDRTYFIIGRDYKITDPQMSLNNLPTETLTEFRRLFPIHEFMRDKRFK